MRIDLLYIQNFRGIESLEIALNPQFNLLIGENGAGKTAILEALTVAMGAFFLGIPGIPARTIQDKDIRFFKTLEGSYEWADKTLVQVRRGWLNGQEIKWHKERNGYYGKTLHGTKNPIKIASTALNTELKNSKRVTEINLPALAYYSTARLWKQGRTQENEEGTFARTLPSRYRGYKDALNTKSSFEQMLRWFKSKFQSMISEGKTSVQLEVVRKAIVRNVPGAVNIKWVFDEDKMKTLYVEFEDQTELPFHYLSDGYRNVMAIFADLAWRCVTLNPHLGEQATEQTEGVVLIDELDLHLHPLWQKHIVQQLKSTFPKIQFITTSHSPFLIQEMSEGELYQIQNNEKISISGANQNSLEDVVERFQKIENPNWSSTKKRMYDAASDYFKQLQELTPDKTQDELERIRMELHLLSKPYADNVAYIAFLEQKRLLAESKLNKPS